MRNISIFFLFFIFIGSCKKTDLTYTSFLNEPAMLVVNGGENSLSVIDPETFEEKHRLFINSPANTFIHHIGLNKTASKFAFAFPEYDFSVGHNGLHNLQVKGYVILYDRKTEKVERTINVPYANHNAIISPDGTEVWTGLVSHTGRVLVYNAQNGVLIKEIPVNPDPHEIIFTEDEKYVLVTGMESSFLTVIDATTKEIVKNIKVDPFPSNVWKGKDKNQVIVENANQNSLNFVDLTLMQVTDHIDLDFTPGFSTFAPNGELWICAKGKDYVYIYEKTGGIWNKEKTILAQNDPHALTFFNGNAWLVNQKQNTVEIFNILTKTKIKEINVGLKPNAIVYMP